MLSSFLSVYSVVSPLVIPIKIPGDNREKEKHAPSTRSEDTRYEKEDRIPFDMHLYDSAVRVLCRETKPDGYNELV